MPWAKLSKTLKLDRMPCSTLEFYRLVVINVKRYELLPSWCFSVLEPAVHPKEVKQKCVDPTSFAEAPAKVTVRDCSSTSVLGFHSTDRNSTAIESNT